MSSAVGRTSVSAGSIDSSIWSSSLSSLSTSSLSDRNSSHRRPSLEQQAQWVQTQAHAHAHAQRGLVSATPHCNMVDDQNQQASIVTGNTVDSGHSNADASQLPLKHRRRATTDPAARVAIEQIIAKELVPQHCYHHHHHHHHQQKQTQQLPTITHSQDTQLQDEVQQHESSSSSLPSSVENDSSLHTPPTLSSVKFTNGTQDSNKTSPKSDSVTESRVTLNGAMSPTGSRSSIVKDIGAPYREHQLQPEPPIDEHLYGLVDRYGFLVEDGRQPTVERRRTSSVGFSRDNWKSLYAKQVELEQMRSFKWTRMATQKLSSTMETVYTFDHPKFESRVYKGIPDCWRTAVWSYLITNRGRDANADVRLREDYPRYCSIPSPEEEQIDLDIPRTMHGHIMFQTRYGSGQCALFNVLKAFSNYDTKVGYCQGMASVVATMLTYFDEEKTFVLLTHLFRRYNLKSVVIPGFPALFEAFYIQEELTRRYAPKISTSLETLGITTDSYASRWYLTLFAAGVVPYRTLLRIWDVLFLEGFEWMYFVALALLKYHEARLIQSNFEQTMELLNARMNIEDDDRLVKIARKYHRRAVKSNIVARFKGQYDDRQRAEKSAQDSTAT